MLLQIYLKSKHYTATVCSFDQGSTDVHQKLVCTIKNAQKQFLSKILYTAIFYQKLKPQRQENKKWPLLALSSLLMYNITA